MAGARMSRFAFLGETTLNDMKPACAHPRTSRALGSEDLIGAYNRRSCISDVFTACSAEAYADSIIICRCRYG
jgi:hypothetical protein